jgi:signal transduction histidine kinase
MAAAGAVEAGNYAVRVDESPHAPPEIRQLVRSFNAMAARLPADDARRRAFLADVSHELRTPLTVIQGSIEAMVDGVHPADAGHLNAVLDEVHVLGRLVEDLRTLVLSDAGAIELHREPTEVGPLLNELVTAFQPAAERARVRLTLEIGPLAALVLEIDRLRMRQVLSNLLDNALRYTPAGGSIAISAQTTDAVLTVTVRDSGPGIPPEVLAHIFDRFVKGADSRGSGLGLAIARNLVRAHGGDIAIDSHRPQPGPRPRRRHRHRQPSPATWSAPRAATSPSTARPAPARASP